MVKGKRKELEEIKEAIEPFDKILVTGCGGCVSVCLAGGQKEVDILISDLKAGYKREKSMKRFGHHTVERQCNPLFLGELDDMVPEFDCLVSMACGAGTQNLAERYHRVPVIPAINTSAIGVDRAIGVYEENCRACGDCVLAYTGGICPVTRCAKGLFNGPCGGTNAGMCEVGSDIPCAWYDIHQRLKEQERLDQILKIRTPMPWRNQVQRTIIQEPYKQRYGLK